MGQVFTTRDVADYMTSMFTLPAGASILDPCFGKGVFINSLIARGNYRVFGIEIDEVLYRGVKKDLGNAGTIINGDFLSYAFETKFDGIVMNPPYIRHEKINNLIMIGISKGKLAEYDEYTCLPKTANMYMYFIVKAIDILKPNGELIVIFPGTWLKARGGAGLRRIIEERCTTISQTTVKEKAFEKNALVEVVILKLRKKSDMEILQSEPSHLAQQCHDYTDTSKLMFKSDIKYLDEYSDIRRGISTGCNRMFVNPKVDINKCGKLIKPMLSSPKNLSMYSTISAKIDNLLVIEKESILNDEILEYLSTWKQKILREHSPKTLYSRILEKDDKWFCLRVPESRGILFAYIIRDSISFLINNIDTIARDNFYIIKPRIDKYLLFALLNNYYTFYQLEERGKRYGAGLLKIQKYDLEEIWLPDINSVTVDDRNRLIEISKKALTGRKGTYIEDFSEVVSKYAQYDLSTMLEMYKGKKSERLGCTK